MTDHIAIPHPDISWNQAEHTHTDLWRDATMPQGSDVWLEWRKHCGGTATQANVVSMNPLPYPHTPKTWADQRAGVGSEISEQGRIAMAHGSEHEDDATTLHGKKRHNRCTTRAYVRAQSASTHTFDNDGKWNLGASLDGFRFDPENRPTRTTSKSSAHTPGTARRRGKTSARAPSQTTTSGRWLTKHSSSADTLDPEKVHGWFVVYLPQRIRTRTPANAFLKFLHVPSTSLMDRMTTLLDLWPRYIGGEVQPGDLRGFSFDTDPDLTMALQSYLEAHKAKAEATKEEARAKKAILEQAMILNGATDPERPPTWIKKIHLDGLTITRTQRNTVNWSQLAKDHPEIDTTPYESATESWRVTVSKDK